MMNNWVKVFVVSFLPEWFYLLSYKKPTSSTWAIPNVMSRLVYSDS